MGEERILALSLFLSTLGLLLLFFVSANQEPTKISSITSDDIGSRAYVKGVVNGLRTSPDGHIFFNLEDGSGEIKVVAFKELAKELFCIEEGKPIELKGEVDEYRGEIELIPSKAADVRC